MVICACGFQVCQFVAFVLDGKSLITAAVNTMASSFIALTITFKAGSSGAVLANETL